MGKKRIDNAWQRGCASNKNEVSKQKLSLMEGEGR